MKSHKTAAFPRFIHLLELKGKTVRHVLRCCPFFFSNAQGSTQQSAQAYLMQWLNLRSQRTCCLSWGKGRGEIKVFMQFQRYWRLCWQLAEIKAKRCLKPPAGWLCVKIWLGIESCVLGRLTAPQMIEDKLLFMPVGTIILKIPLSEWCGKQVTPCLSKVWSSRVGQKRRPVTVIGLKHTKGMSAFYKTVSACRC